MGLTGYRLQVAGYRWQVLVASICQSMPYYEYHRHALALYMVCLCVSYIELLATLKPERGFTATNPPLPRRVFSQLLAALSQFPPREAQ